MLYDYANRTRNPWAKLPFCAKHVPQSRQISLPTKPVTTLEVVLPDWEPGKQTRKRVDLRAVRLARDGQGILLLGADDISRAELDLFEIGEALGADWLLLARELGVDQTDISGLKEDYRGETERAYAMLLLWKKDRGDNATGKVLFFKTFWIH